MSSASDTTFAWQPLRFIHASDLHLDKTLEGVAEGPQHWEDRMLDISKRAAERLFQRAIEEEVDFLLLSGDVINVSLAPPGTLLFLLEQFERLQKAEITVYWAGGEFDSPEDWLTAFPLPPNVKHFPCNSVQEYYVQRPVGNENVPIAKIAGISRNQQRKRIRSSEFPYDPTGLFCIAAANGDVEPETLSDRRIDYWAMGGRSRRFVYHGNPRKRSADGKAIHFDAPTGTKRDKKDLPPLPFIVHYPGAPLARTPKDLGAFGATLVEVPLGENGEPIDDPVLTYFSTSPIRWIDEHITLAATDDGGKLADELRNRLKNLRESQKGDDLFINWFVDMPPGTLATQLRRGGLANDLLSELRSLYGQAELLTWSVSLSVLVPEKLPKAQYEQQTILGDFLRSVKHFQDNPSEIVHLEGYLPKNWDEDVAKTLLFADKVKSEITDAQDKELKENTEGKSKERWIQTSQQAETQQKVLSEAALAGLEVLGAVSSGKIGIEGS